MVPLYLLMHFFSVLRVDALNKVHLTVSGGVRISLLFFVLSCSWNFLLSSFSS